MDNHPFNEHNLMLTMKYPNCFQTFKHSNINLYNFLSFHVKNWQFVTFCLTLFLAPLKTLLVWLIKSSKFIRNILSSSSQNNQPTVEKKCLQLCSCFHVIAIQKITTYVSCCCNLPQKIKNVDLNITFMTAHK